MSRSSPGWRGFYFALGDDAEQMARDSLGDYYAFLGDIAEQIVAGAAKAAAR